jgi:hypothetical protein
MAQWILNENGKVVPQCMLCCLSPAELPPTNEVEVEKQALFNTPICRLGNSVKIPNDIPLDNEATEAFDELWDLKPSEDDHETKFHIPNADIKDAAGKPYENKLLADTLIIADVLLPNEDSQAIAWVVRQATNEDGRLIGTFNKNPLLNTSLYECEFDDGTTREYAANVIASNIFMELYDDGFSSSHLYHIVDHKCSGEAITMADKYFVTKTGTKRMRQTTVGWKFLAEWANGSQQWIELKILKESNPNQVAEYAMASNIREEPAFAW